MSSNEQEEVKKDYILSNKQYDRLKVLAQLILPGTGALYFALAGIWGLPKAEEVIGTIAAIDVFLGLFLSRASSSYDTSSGKYDGFIDVDTNEDGEPHVATMQLTKLENPNDIVNLKQVTFKVNSTRQ